MLRVTKAAIAIMSTAQTNAAAAIALSERHGDGGAQFLADAAGLSRRDARGQVNAARAIDAQSTARDPPVGPKPAMGFIWAIRRAGEI